MKTREEATKYGLSFPDTYLETPFHDPNCAWKQKGIFVGI